jgi:NAD(P)H-dependent FMN reductase
MRSNTIMPAFAWHRLWVAREHHSAASPGVMVAENWIAQAAGESLEQLEETPCLILLGESGMGKTYAMRSERDRIHSRGGDVLAVDLREYASDDRLHREVFDGAQWKVWRAGDRVLWLFIDAWEESLIRLQNLAAYLASQLAGIDAARLRLRIASRPVEWSVELESGLMALFGDDSVQACNLLPLTEDDVRSAATASGVEAGAFMTELDQLRLLPLASRPLTLRFLLDSFEESGSLPDTQEQAYAQGLLRLCREPQPTLRRQRVDRGLSEEHVLAAASRIAAVTLLCRKSSVVVDWQGGRLPDEDIRTADIVGYLPEMVNDRGIDIREPELHAALATGLFTAAGPGRVRWAHQSYAEYLAARYLVRHGMPSKQVLPLIQSAGDPEGKLVPQLHGLAGWLYGMDSGVVDEVLVREPEALVGSGVIAADAADRRRLVDSLLDAFAAERLELTNQLVQSLRGLDHPELADQLRAAVLDRGVAEASRMAAVQVAIACRVSSLSDAFADLALDPSEDLSLRKRCVHALYSIGTAAARGRMRLLVLRAVPGSDDRELRHWAIACAWRLTITVAEALNALEMPHGYIDGSVVFLLVRDLPESLTEGELPGALEWVARQPASIEISVQAHSIIEKILTGAWDHIGSAAVAEAFGRALWARLGYHEPLPPPVGRTTADATPHDLAARRNVLRVAIPVGTSPREAAARLSFAPRPFLASPDLGWLIEELNTETDPAWRLILSGLICYVTDQRDLDQVGALFEAAASSPELRQLIRPLTEPVPLDSEVARQQREMYQRIRRLEEQRRLDPQAGVDWAGELAAGLDRCREEPSFFWWLNVMLARDERTADISSDLRELPGWQEADEPTRREIVAAASRYTTQADAPTWGEHPEQSRPGLSAVRALRLLMDEAPGEFEATRSDVWARWAAAVMAYPDYHGNDPAFLKNMVARACREAPDATAAAATGQIVRESAAELHHLFVLGRLRDCGDGPMVDALARIAADDSLHPQVLAEVLEQLLRWAPEIGREAALVVVEELGKAQSATDRALAAARVLLLEDTEQSWSAVWKSLVRHPDRADEVITGMAVTLGLEAGRVTARLDTSDLIALCEWLIDRFPPAPDAASVPSPRYLTPFDSVEDMRRAGLNELAGRGTRDASSALERMSAGHPDDMQLRHLAGIARTVLRARSWIAPSPAELLRMVASHESRWVESPDHLLDLVLEALAAYQVKLRHESWVVEGLWDQDRAGGWSPKPETQFRDAVAAHLRDVLRGRMVVVNREVEVGRLPGAHTGQRTDILVTAVRNDPAGRGGDTVSVVIEVKGCWHAEWRTAMRSQLVDDYMDSSGLTHGVYLVGWFDCEAWKTGVGRTRCRGGAESARRQLGRLASDLSIDARRISARVIEAPLRNK